ncbi:MAG TPA: Mur ligase family protein [Candidatus Saccharimonadales bacterium]
MRIRNIEEANAVLLPYVPLVAELTGKDVTLERIRPFMALLGNPQDRLKVVHIAGTSGKTSTAYYMAALLRATGASVGLAVSPHIDSIRERAQVNGELLPEAAFCEHLGVFMDLVKQSPESPTYFELLYAFAPWLFDRLGLDYAVIETGMGGLHDATNVASRADKVCIITDIGYDHMHILGNTLAKIAAQKAGIIHQGNTVFTFEQDKEIMDVIKSEAASKKAALHSIAANPELFEQADFGADMTEYQKRNWLLAQKTTDYIINRDRLQHLTRQVLHKTQATKIPARMDEVQVGDKKLIMDGAHNAQKMVAFVDSLRLRYPGAHPALLVSLKTGKDYEQVVPLLAQWPSQIIVTTFETTQDLPVKSMNPDVLAEAFRQAGAKHVTSIADQHEAYQALLAQPEKLCVIAGSFYLLSQLRNNEHIV